MKFLVTKVQITLKKGKKSNLEYLQNYEIKQETIKMTYKRRNTLRELNSQQVRLMNLIWGL